MARVKINIRPLRNLLRMNVTLGTFFLKTVQVLSNCNYTFNLRVNMVFIIKKNIPCVSPFKRDFSLPIYLKRKSVFHIF